MHESTRELEALQQLLDQSFAPAGEHLRSVFPRGRGMSAAEVAARLQGVFIWHLATVSSSNRPVVAPIDGLFFRGRLLFSAPEQSVRVQHLRRRPYVSATHSEGEAVCIIVHGRAVDVPANDSEVSTFIAQAYGAAVLEASSMPGLTAFIEPSFMVAFGPKRGAS